MRIASRPAVLVAATLAVGLAGSPALAATQHATKHTGHHTSLNARAAKGVARTKHTDTVNLTLRSGKTGVAGEAANFMVRSRRDVPGTKKWGAWAPIAATPGANDGQYTVTVLLAPQTMKGHKEQFQVEFTGDPANNLAASHSEVFTIK